MFSPLNPSTGGPTAAPAGLEGSRRARLTDSFAAHRVASAVVDRGRRIATAGELATDVIVLDDRSAGGDISVGSDSAANRIPSELDAALVAVQGDGAVDDVGRAGHSIVADHDEVRAVRHLDGAPNS